MFSYQFYLFCLAGILCICLCVGNSKVNKCAEGDKQALLKFKADLIDEDGILSSWKGEDCCKWEGITCDSSTGLVTRLDFQDQGLRGMINSSICELQHLTSLDLKDNNLGKIPNYIGSLGQFIELNLAFNELVGAIPHALGNLSNLQTLVLKNNSYLVANDLEWVSHLSNLRYLDMSNDNLSQAVDWLSSISKLPSILELQLYHCGLPQFNEKYIPQNNSSTSLEVLDLSENNYLNSLTLSWVLNASKVLTVLDLSNNSLQHNIPKGFENMISLQYLDLSYNFLQQSIPEGFANMSSLKVLSLSHNELVGSITKSFQSLCQLRILILSFNKLSGQLNDFVLSHSIQELDFSHNQLTGTLPYTIGKLSNLNYLSAYSNKLNVVVNETHLSNLSSLQILYMDQNSLLFNLSSNWVPPFLLSELSVSSCILGPKFPSWLKHQRVLELLQISNGGISYSFPKWFWALSPGLTYLNVSHNKLSGALPKSIPIAEWDLSFNNFSGPLPHFPPSSGLLSLAEWDLSFNNFSGPLPHFPPSLGLPSVSNNIFSGSISSFCATPYTTLASLDLSYNFLKRRLPDCWGQFQALQVLNLATNSFLGGIPESFGTLQQIETIHLNNSNFSGEVPSLTHCSP